VRTCSRWLRSAFGAVDRGPVHTLPILYDADCGFCRWSLAKVLAWDRARRLRPVAIQDPEAGGLIASVPVERRLTSWHLVLPDGRVCSGGAAFAPLLRLLPGGRLLAPLPASLPGLAERAYRLVADNRTPLGRLVPAAGAARAAQQIAERAGHSRPSAPGSSCGVRLANR